jgi:hypothetical protein
LVSRLLRLTLLVPDIQEAILDWRQPKGMQLEELTRTVPRAWEEQRHVLGWSAGTPHAEARSACRDTLQALDGFGDAVRHEDRNN